MLHMRFLVSLSYFAQPSRRSARRISVPEGRAHSSEHLWFPLRATPLLNLLPLNFSSLLRSTTRQYRIAKSWINYIFLVVPRPLGPRLPRAAILWPEELWKYERSP